MGPRVVAGRYELREQVGASSWRATDTELGRDVLVRLGGAPEAGAALSHPGIVRVYDQGEEDGKRYAVLEYLTGGTLAERGALTGAAAAEVAAALAYAHEQGIAHGALGPETILFDSEGRAKLTGFRGEGDPASDLAVLDALRGEHEVTAVTAALPAPEPPPVAGRRRRPPVLLALLALALVAAGVAAAFLATSGDSPGDEPGTTASLPRPTTGTTEEPAPPTTQETTETTTTQPTTTTDDTVPVTTTLEPPPIKPPLPTVPPSPPPTEPITETPPLPTEPPEPPTTEPPPTITGQP